LLSKRFFQLSALLLLGVCVVLAQWNALSSGYAVTTDWHGREVPIHVYVTAWAGTTKGDSKWVEFKWIDPNGNLRRTEVKTLSDIYDLYETPNVPPGVPKEIEDWAKDNPGVKVWYAYDTYALDVVGEWTVKAVFPQGSVDVKQRATSLYAVPEVILGSLAAMFGALGLVAIKRRRNIPIR
jgi:hypothetical protein